MAPLRRSIGRMLRLFVVSQLVFVSIGAVNVSALEPINSNDQKQSLSDFMLAVRAYEKGDLKTAAQAIEKAYVQNPGDSQIKRMMTLINKARSRQQAMNEAVKWVEKPENEAQVLAKMTADEKAASSKMPEAESKKAAQVAQTVSSEKKNKAASENEPQPPADIFAETGQVTVGERNAPSLFSSLSDFNFSDFLDRHTGISEERDRFEVLTTPTRAGAQRFYKEGIGFQPVPGIGFSMRTEIFEEANAVDDYITEAKILNRNSEAEFRNQITPIFTRAWAARTVIDYDPWPRFTYEFDKRHIYHEFQDRFNFKDRNLESHIFNFLYTFPEIPHVGRITIQPWYKRVFQESDDNTGTFEDRDEIITAISLRPTIAENVELYFQYNGAQVEKTKSLGESNSKDFTVQARMSFPSLKLFVIPNYTYSETNFNPGEDQFIKRDWFVDWGFDISDKLRASSKQQLIVAEVSRLGVDPVNPRAQVFNTRNKLSYEIIKDLDLSVGLNYSKANGLNVYDNYGLLAEMELFKPGIIRASVGYELINYYNLDDKLSLLAFKLFLFQ